MSTALKMNQQKTLSRWRLAARWVGAALWLLVAIIVVLMARNPRVRDADRAQQARQLALRDDQFQPLDDDQQPAELPPGTEKRMALTAGEAEAENAASAADNPVSALDAAGPEKAKPGRVEEGPGVVRMPDGSLLIDPTKLQPAAAGWDPNGLEDFSFQNVDGAKVTKQDLLGKPWAISFVFTHCLGPCPRVTQRMKDLQSQLKYYDVRLVTLTVDPERDTAEVLKKYAEIHQADPARWMFLTGERDVIYPFIRDNFKVPVEETVGPDRKPGYEVIHSTAIFLVKSDGVIFDRYSASSDDEAARMRRDMTKLAQRLPDAPPIDMTPASPEQARSNSMPDLPARVAPPAVLNLPFVNACLNSLATVLLIFGYILIKQKQRTAHQWVMQSAFVTSILFLACYLTYHEALRHFTGQTFRAFAGPSWAVPWYRTILLTHVVLAAAVPFLAGITLWRAWKQNWAGHRRIAKVTFPIWLYVSVTGVVIYVMLYHWPK